MFLRWTRATPEPHEEIAPGPEIEMPVAPDWDVLVRKADAMADVIDRHIAYESALQGREMTVGALCPAQKASLASDVARLVRGEA